MHYAVAESTTKTMHQTGSESTTGTGGMEAMVVDFTTVVGKPLVRKDGDRIVISNLMGPPFPISEKPMSLPDCKLKELIRGMKRLGESGDREGLKGCARKRKRQVPLENRHYRIPLTYLIMIGREKDRETYEIVITFIRNQVAPARCWDDQMECFCDMTNEETQRFLDAFLTQCAKELSEALGGEYEYAQKLGAEFDYLNLPGQSKHANI